jgi:hypothetical protein
VALSLPTVVGEDGGTRVLVPHMNEGEADALARSAKALRDAAASLTA